MKKRPLGRTGVELSEIGIGTWEISGDVWGKKDDIESKKAIHVALDSGANFIDTAAWYGRGHAEQLVGQVLRERRSARDAIIISTKIAPNCGIFTPSPEKPIDDFYSAEWIFEQCEASLKRLGVDTIDIMFLHTWSRSWGHRTEWADAMDELKAQGKIRFSGISIPDEGIADANVHIESRRVDVIQCVYNIFQQEPKYTLFPLASKHGVGIIARSPFSSGALSQSWTPRMSFPSGDWRGIWPQDVKPGWLEEQVAMATLVKSIASKIELPITTIALKYVLTSAHVSSVVPGTANPEHALANTKAADGPGLSPDLLDEFKNLWLKGKIHGTYNGSI